MTTLCFDENKSRLEWKCMLYLGNLENFFFGGEKCICKAHKGFPEFFFFKCSGKINPKATVKDSGHFLKFSCLFIFLVFHCTPLLLFHMCSQQHFLYNINWNGFFFPAWKWELPKWISLNWKHHCIKTNTRQQTCSNELLCSANLIFFFFF